ncbi:MAG: hypothetical protein J7518_17060 [Nocardioidaceae bacterium]|nr:hypothetical protein [Nocardioidaceae bacterium]
MNSNDKQLSEPRHRKKGRASKRGSSLPGRHVRIADDADCTCPPGFHEYGAHAPGFGPPPIQDGPSRPGAYPVEDLARMSTSAADLLLRRAGQETGLPGSPAVPHVLITRDAGTGAIRYDGPFPTGLEALTVAHRFVQQNREQRPAWAFTLTVAPLLPH